MVGSELSDAESYHRGKCNANFRRFIGWSRCFLSGPVLPRAPNLSTLQRDQQFVLPMTRYDPANTSDGRFARRPH
jgi:hypothetical protein